MTAIATNLAGPLAGYARKFHAAIEPGHAVASPLGAWLLLALCGPACHGAARAEVADALGCDIDLAAATAAALLDNPHPLVAAAAGVWRRRDIPAARLAEWLARLPGPVESGVLTTQQALDDWALEHTLGLIKRFPLDLTPDTLLILATALATRVSWETPFDLSPASALGAGPWASSLRRVLRTPAGYGHTQFIAATEQAGDVAVHSAQARGGLTVTSVIAGEGVPASDVLAAAYQLAPAVALNAPLARRSLFDLPLGDGPLWSVSEQQVHTQAPDGREERCTAVLPAWSASSGHKLLRDGLGFLPAAEALGKLVGGGQYEAAQAAVARFSRVGFEAAAVSAVLVATSMPVLRPGLRRTAELRFGHPFAVVAVATDDPREQRPGPAVPGPWHGIPVFSAWVAEPAEADEDPAS